MKTILFFILSLLSCCFYVNATNYYVAKSGSNTNSGISPATPFKTFSPFGVVTFAGGDTVFINGGDTIRGQLNINQSGTLSNPIVITSYGTGKGIISGAQTISGFTPIGGGVFQSGIIGTTKIFFVNNVEQEVARYPNAHRYLQLDSAQLGYLKDASITSLPANYFSGSKVCIHTAQWCWEKSGVQNIVGDKLSYTTALTLAAISKYGYFLYDNVNLLDTVGEFFYETSTGKLDFMPPATMNINLQNCEGSVYGAGVQLNGNTSYITIQNLVFDKQTVTGVNMSSTSKHVNISNCEFYRQYNHGIAAKGKYHTISNCVFENMDGHGVDVSAANCEIHHNTFKNIGLVRNGGIGGQTNLSAIAINFVDSNFIHHNLIDSVGYCGVSADGGYNIVERNIASHCMLINNDGAPFKTFGTTSYKEIIRNNFAHDTYGNKEGTFNGQFKTPAFYFDNYTNFCLLENNTAYNVPATGIFQNAASHDNSVFGNVIYGGDFGININGTQQMPAPITGINVKHNTFFALENNDVCLRQVDYLNTFNQGVIDSNYLWQAYDANKVCLRYVGTTPTNYSFAAWQTASGNDLHSVDAFVNLGTSTFTSVLLMNQTDNISTITLGDTLYFDLDSNDICGSIQLQPYTSKVLINTHTYFACANGVAAIEPFDGFSLYPNPVAESLVISHQSLGNTNTIQVFDLYGRKLIEQPITNHNSEIINVSNFTSGIYFVRIGNSNKKFVKY
jgi:hypothetical protein